eukprot:9172998-Prorocentrum_lima.AAC.1
MTSSLVGSEMCIRDSLKWQQQSVDFVRREAEHAKLMDGKESILGKSPVSYTHLTLPTICSV